MSGLELVGKVHVEVINSASVSEIPVLVGNTTHLQLSLVKGRATVQVRIVLTRMHFQLLIDFVELEWSYIIFGL